MSYKIVMDSCGELPEEYKKDGRFELVPLTLEVGEYTTLDDENFNQAEFLKKVAECPLCPKSACPSPERYMESYVTDAEHVYVITLSGNLSGSYNSAVLGKNLYEETYGEKQIFVVDSCSASNGQTQIAYKIMELEERGLPFEEICKELITFRDERNTYFVLDNLETLRKNGRLSAVKALVASTLSIKPVMIGNKQGIIEQKANAIGIRKGLQKLAEFAAKEAIRPEEKILMITHVNCPDRAEYVKKEVLARVQVKDVLILSAAGVSSMYANDGGVVVTL